MPCARPFELRYELQLTHAQYDALERAVIDHRRISIYRRGTEYVVVPRSLRLQNGREMIETTHPTTGDPLVFYLDELEGLNIVR